MEYSNYSIIYASQLSDHIQGVYCKYHRKLASDIYAKLKSISDSLVLLGDFNFNDINWESLYGNSPVSTKFCEIIFDLNLCQLVSEPAHIHGNILDLVLTNNPDNIVDLIVHSKPPFSISSDHFVITFRIYSRTVHSTCKVGSRLRNFSRGDFEGLCHYLSNSNFTPCYQTNDIEFVWSFISTTIKNAMDHFIPFTIVHQAHQPKWFNSSIRHRIKCLNTLRRKCNKHPTATIRTKIEESEKLLQAEISKL